MKENRKEKRLKRIFSLPEELDPHRFSVEWRGNGACVVEQHRGVLCFEPSLIRFSTEQGVLSVEGDALEMESLTGASARVRGGVRSVSLEAKS